MKIIDLLNKIANGEDVPNNIRLNDTVEILEEEKKIPEKIEREVHIENGVEISSEPSIEQIMDKINEIIDYLKSKGE